MGRDKEKKRRGSDLKQKVVKQPLAKIKTTVHTTQQTFHTFHPDVAERIADEPKRKEPSTSEGKKSKKEKKDRRMSRAERYRQMGEQLKERDEERERAREKRERGSQELGHTSKNKKSGRGRTNSHSRNEDDDDEEEMEEYTHSHRSREKEEEEEEEEASEGTPLLPSFVRNPIREAAEKRWVSRETKRGIKKKFTYCKLCFFGKCCWCFSCFDSQV
jgi:hypothetical protein